MLVSPSLPSQPMVVGGDTLPPLWKPSASLLIQTSSWEGLGCMVDEELTMLRLRSALWEVT